MPHENSMTNQFSSLNQPGKDPDFERARMEGVGDTLLAIQRICSPAYFPGYQMAESDFIQIYGKETVSQAMEKSAKLKQQHNVDIGTFAAVAETIPLLGNTHNFFGQDSEGSPIEIGIYGTAPAEDYGEPNGDLIFEIKNVYDKPTTAKHAFKPVTRFIVDVTTAGEADIQGKINRSEKIFKAGKLHDILFFKSKINPNAPIGVQNVPNLILSIKEEELVAFLRKVRPYIDVQSNVIINREKFDEAYQDFAEDLRGSLLIQAIEQAKVFASVCFAGGVITDPEQQEIAKELDAGDILKTFASVEKIIDKIQGSRIIPEERKNNSLKYLRSLKTLVETAVSLDNINKRKKKNSLTQERKAA